MRIRKYFLLILILCIDFPLNALPFKGDVVVKTDIGEKYLVKKSTLKITEYSSNKLTTKINSERKKILENYQSCIDIYGEQPFNLEGYVALRKSLGATDEQARNYFGKDVSFYKDKSHCKVAHLKESINFDNPKKFLNEELDLVRKNNLSMHFVSISFRAIFTDLNDFKTALDSDYVYCINPKIKKETVKLWDKYFLVDPFRLQKKKKSSNQIKLVKQKLCNQYAKF